MTIGGAALLAPLTPAKADAARRYGDDGNVTFGAQVDIWGDRVTQSVDIAVDMNLNWLLVEFDWARMWPQENGKLRSGHFSEFMALAEQRDIQVLVSITHPPEWAQTPHGPDADKTAALVRALLQSYPAISAVEVFPGANTTAGWYGIPDPNAYLTVLKSVQRAIRDSAKEIVLVTGGFGPQAAPDDIEEAHFLDGMYQAGGQDLIGPVSLRFPEGSQQPGEAQEGLARYERLRLVMMKHEDVAGRIWVTGFSWPAQFSSADQEQTWLFQSYQALQSQLYIEAAFFSTLNPPSIFEGWQANSLIGRNGSIHRALQFFHTIFGGDNYAASLLNNAGEGDS
jgi:hypothetical protein